MTFTTDQIRQAAADTLLVQEEQWELAMTDPLWIRMYVSNLRQECACGECSPNATRDTT